MPLYVNELHEVHENLLSITQHPVNTLHILIGCDF